MIKVQLIDDSALVRQVLRDLLNVPGIEVINAARDPIYAMAQMEKQWPDVIILDIEMPRMDGITFLKKIMLSRPTPVVICSTLTDKGAEVTMQALSAGAVDIITKPQIGLKSFLESSREQLIMAVKAASQARLRSMSTRLRDVSSSKATLASMKTENPKLSAYKTTDAVVAIGTSTGGTQALEAVLTRLPTSIPGIVIVQHMPENFTAAFALRLNSLCKINVKEAQSGDRVIPGLALIANGGRHMELKRNGAQYVVALKDGPPISRHKPSVDVLFRSVAKVAGQNALGIIMTGMGDDGVKGLLEMRESGAMTLAQDEASCVVYGMPKEAMKYNAAVKEVSLLDIPEQIIQYGEAHKV